MHPSRHHSRAGSDSGRGTYQGTLLNREREIWGLTIWSLVRPSHGEVRGTNSTNYIVGDIVSHSSSAWIAVEINSNSEPATTSTDWNEFAEGGIAGQDGERMAEDGIRWYETESDSDGGMSGLRQSHYVVNDIVQHEGSAWISTVDSTNEAPSGASGFWDLYAQAGEAGDDGTGFNWRGPWS